MGQEVLGLSRGEGGRVTGVKVQTSKGLQLIGATCGVIFGSGGFSHNKDPIEKQEKHGKHM